ncbi:CsbD family protein [Rhodopirellula baltica]|uniref:CsbD family protein n=1 Tax=Rhodopirellula baltica WH47 TaxID=991778 RepID=F2B125_RHOBT|nr:CsbD family protein [Rhodopirellula baltica]EGF24377.1 CsbD family protein [Rhodopirellula baltica WH47]
MISQQTLQGNWNEIKGRLRSKWGELTDDDVMTFNGDVDQLVGTIQEKTGEARTNIEQFFDEFSSDASAALKHSRESERATFSRAATCAQEASQHAGESVCDGYAEAEGMVRRHPTGSLVVCFGTGLVAGVAVSLLLRWR